MKEIIEKVKKYVKKECEKPEACFKGAYEEHFIPTVKYALKLAEEQNADKEIVEIAAWLHDIGSIKGYHKNHHISSAKIAEQFLKKLNYPQDKIEKIKHCIFAHRGSVLIKKETKEAQIIADADVLSTFDVIDILVKRGYGTKESGYGNAKTKQEAKKVILGKLERSYIKLSDNAKYLIKDKLKRARKELK